MADGIPGRLRAAWKALTAPATESPSLTDRATDATVAAAIEANGSPVPLSSPRLGNMWRTEYAVRTVVDFVAQKIASLPFHAYRELPDGDRVRAADSELGRLIADPSIVPCETRFRLFHALITDTMLSDRWLCLVQVDSEYSYRLRRVPPTCFDVEYNGIGEPRRVTVTLETGSQVYDLPDPRIVLSLGFGGDCGTPFPVTSSLKPLLMEARELAAYRRSVARNGGRIPAWISRDAGIEWASDEQRNEFIHMMRNYRKGGGQEGGWPLLEDGMQIHELDAFKPVDMADLDARDRINIQVCNAYHISPENVGFRTTTKSGMQAYKEQLWNIELRPYIIAFEQILNKTLPAALSESGVWVEANLDAQLRGTTTEQYQALSTATGRPFMATDEARAIVNLPRIGEGYDKPITPLNVTTGGQPSPQDGGRTQNAQEGASPNGKE